MEEDPVAVEDASAVPQQQFILNLLLLIRTAQAQNGIKHADYTRYRRHCANKLQSLYKVLTFQHGRTKYQKRRLEPATITDARFLHIPVFSAERAWAYAMELKKEVEQKMDLRKRRHLVKRLAKAYYWSAEVVRLAVERCDTKGILEAEGYSAWMHGNLLLEKESDWELALAKFLRAKKLFDELAKVVPLDQQTMCLQLVEEMEPAIRYCNYQIKRKGGAVPDASELLAMADQEGRRGMDLLQSKLAALAEEAQVQQAASTSYLQWQGATHPVRAERVKVSLHQANEFASQLEGVMDTDAADDGSVLEGKLMLYDKMINAYNEARSHVRNAIKASTATEGDAQHDELVGLETAVQGTLLERTIDRTLLMVADGQTRFNAGLERLALGKKAKEKDKYSKPEDMVRVLDTLVRNYQDLSDLGARLGGRQGEALHDLCGAKIAVAQASRCYYAGHAYLAAGDKPLEAYAVFSRALERATAAAERVKEQPGAQDKAALDELEALTKAATAYRAVAHAEHVGAVLKEKEAVQQGVGAMALSEQQQQQQAERGFLLDNLDVFESFAGQPGGKAPHIYKIPFEMQAIPARAIMLDTASNYVSYPSLEHRVKAKATDKKGAAATGTAASMLSSLWGGWGAKK